jgi:hypothetical protein
MGYLRSGSGLTSVWAAIMSFFLQSLVASMILNSELTVYLSYVHSIFIRIWLTWLWRLRSPKICCLQAGHSGKSGS